MIGIIIKNTGNDCWLRTENGTVEMCKVKGNFRIKGIKSTNPVAVGDKVEVDASGFISHIFDRKNYIVRRPANLSKQIHILAANIDIALLAATIKNPVTSPIFIDRFLAAAESFSVPAILIFNKIDLLENDDENHLDLLIKLYQSIGYQCLKTSMLNKTGIDEIKRVIEGKIVLLAGNSGVGKSSIINAVVENNVAKTAKISEYHLKGMHTTTFSEMFYVDNQTFIIDTPGIKGFGTIDMQENEIGHYFREIFAESKHCRFPNCTHRCEPNCAVLQAVEDKKIAPSRYRSYLSIMEDAKEEKYR
jgi:ribosome biogenesis GTPase